MTVPLPPAGGFVIVLTPSNGTLNLPYDYKLLFDEQITVERAPDINSPFVTLSLGVDYTVTGIRVDLGGTVILTIAADGSQVFRLSRITPLERNVDYTVQGDITPLSLNDQWDLQLMMIQEFEIGIINRLLVYNTTDLITFPDDNIIPKVPTPTGSDLGILAKQNDGAWHAVIGNVSNLVPSTLRSELADQTIGLSGTTLVGHHTPSSSMPTAGPEAYPIGGRTSRVALNAMEDNITKVRTSTTDETVDFLLNKLTSTDTSITFTNPGLPADGKVNLSVNFPSTQIEVATFSEIINALVPAGIVHLNTTDSSFNTDLVLNPATFKITVQPNKRYKINFAVQVDVGGGSESSASLLNSTLLTTLITGLNNHAEAPTTSVVAPSMGFGIIGPFLAPTEVNLVRGSSVTPVGGVNKLASIIFERIG